MSALLNLGIQSSLRRDAYSRIICLTKSKAKKVMTLIGTRGEPVIEPSRLVWGIGDQNVENEHFVEAKWGEQIRRPDLTV